MIKRKNCIILVQRREFKYTNEKVSKRVYIIPSGSSYDLLSKKIFPGMLSALFFDEQITKQKNLIHMLTELEHFPKSISSVQL